MPRPTAAASTSERLVASEPTAAASSAATPPAGPKVTRARKPRRRYVSTIPDDILNDPKLRSMLDVLPPNYNFEVAKTVWRIKQMGAKSVALQFPEGLLMYATHIADILEEVAGAEAVILGDVTYGACCVDDLSAAALGCELLVHYAHSCLVPIDRMALEVMYVFVEIEVDLAHLVDTVTSAWASSAIRSAAVPAAASGSTATSPPRACRGATAVGGRGPRLHRAADHRRRPRRLRRRRPLHRGGDDRQPHAALYRADPYAKAITRERYDHGRMESCCGGRRGRAAPSSGVSSSAHGPPRTAKDSRC